MHLYTLSLLFLCSFFMTYADENPAIQHAINEQPIAIVMDMHEAEYKLCGDKCVINTAKSFVLGTAVTTTCFMGSGVVPFSAPVLCIQGMSAGLIGASFCIPAENRE